MKKYCLLYVLLAWGYWAKAQYAEPAVTGANFVPNTVSVGNEAVLKVSFANSGSTPIPVNSIELTISTAPVYYKTDGTTPPTGAGAALFNWTYLGSDRWRGSNKVAVAAYGGGTIELKVKGILVSTAFETTNINVQPTANFTAFSDAPSNNNLQPKLKITAATTPPFIFAYDDFGVTSKGTLISNSVLSNDDLGTGVAPLVITTAPVVSPTNGTVTINANGRYTYQPNANYTGTDSFKYRVCDSGNPGVCDTATVTITIIDSGVVSGNRAPIAAADNIAVKQGATAVGNVLQNDVELDANQTLTAAIVTQPAKGTLTLNANGTYSYVAGANSLGNDSFTYKACDNGNPQLCSTVRVDINIYGSSAANLPPVANADVVLRAPLSPATGNVLTNDKDPEGGTLTVATTPITPPAHGTVALSANGAFTYTPAAGYTGMDQFVYEVCDSYTPKACSQALVFIVPQQVAQGVANVSVSKTLIGNKVRTLYETVSYRVVLKNAGPDAATNVVVKDSTSSGLQIVSGTATVGTFTNGQWSVPVLASGDSAVLTVSVKLAVAGVSFNYARVVSLDQTDSNKSNNESEACVSVPHQLCAAEKMEVSVPASYTNVKWFKDGAQVATGNIVLLTDAGTYTFTATNVTCPVSGCCPLVIEASSNCCPVQICVPVTVVKKKK